MEEVAEILSVYNNLENPRSILPCSSGEFVQWLISVVDNPKIGIWGKQQPVGVSSYIVAVNNIIPPISNYITVIQFEGDDLNEVELLFKEVFKWQELIGAKEINIYCEENEIEFLEEVGFNKKSYILGKV